MDINYLLEREQVSLHNAEVAASATARIAHSGLAAGYGALLADNGFPHRAKFEEAEAVRKEPSVLDWENEGGSADQPHGEVPATTATRSLAPDGTPDASRGHVAKTPEEERPYVVFWRTRTAPARNRPCRASGQAKS
jgi:hypothetical protein